MRVVLGMSLQLSFWIDGAEYQNELMLVLKLDIILGKGKGEPRNWGDQQNKGLSTN